MSSDSLTVIEGYLLRSGLAKFGVSPGGINQFMQLLPVVSPDDRGKIVGMLVKLSRETAIGLEDLLGGMSPMGGNAFFAGQPVTYPPDREVLRDALIMLLAPPARAAPKPSRPSSGGSWGGHWRHHLKED
jgi:hypothetical protein